MPFLTRFYFCLRFDSLPHRILQQIQFGFGWNAQAILFPWTLKSTFGSRNLNQKPLPDLDAPLPHPLGPSLSLHIMAYLLTT